jgi:hypothetical protein
MLNFLSRLLRSTCCRSADAAKKITDQGICRAQKFQEPKIPSNNNLAQIYRSSLARKTAARGGLADLDLGVAQRHKARLRQAHGE